MMRQAALATALALAAAAQGVHAHGDADIRFVTPGGADAFGCDRADAPCATIGYAAGQAGKGGIVRVAAGAYELASQADLFFLSSDSGADVTGGWSIDFTEHDPVRHRTLLISVPPALRTALEARGFQVLTDRKWDGTGLGADPELLAATTAPMLKSAGATPCTGGAAAGFACSGIDLLAHVALGDFGAAPGRANDIWGFVDLNTDRAYALVGLGNGAAVFDVTDPSAPVEIGSVDGEETGWRDLKVVQRFDAGADRWNAYAYVTADAVHDRLTVIDLTGLPNRIALAARATDDLSAHNLNVAGVDPAYGVPLPGREPVLVVAGSNLGGGAFRAFSIADPEQPVPIASGNAGYMHDGTAMLLHDPAQCAPAAAPCEILADFNEFTVDLWDVTAPGAPVPLSSTTYSSARYVHSGSWSEDGRHLFLHDELDESHLGVNSTMYVFDVSDLRDPQPAGTWTGPTRAIDHNGYPRGNRYYISNYQRGLTVLDITDAAAPVDAGFFDTFPVGNEPGFAGAWGVYPHLPSRAVLVSDIQAGLFVFADRTLDVAQGTLGFDGASFAAERGTTAALPVARTGGTDGAVSVAWEVLHGTTTGADVAVARGRLDWPHDDGSFRHVMLPLPAGGDAMDRFLVRLYDPTGGATLGAHGYASVFVAPPGAATGFEFLDAPRIEEDAARALVVVRRTGTAAGAASVDYSTAAGSAAGADFTAVSGTLSWPDGDATARTIVVPVTSDDTGEGDESFTVSLSSGAQTTVTIAAHTGTAPQPPPQPPPAPAPGGGGGGHGGWLLAAAALLLTRASGPRCPPTRRCGVPARASRAAGRRARIRPRPA